MPFDMEDVVRPYIVGIGARVTSEDIDTYDRLEQVASRAEGRRTERTLRRIYGLALLTLLSIEIVAVLVITFLIGFGAVAIDRWVATTFIGGTFSQVSGMAFLVIRYLFPLRPVGDDFDKS
jgi:hypothetical protein